VRPVASLGQELWITGIGGVLIGLAGQIGASIGGSGFVGSAVPFLVLALLFGFIQFRGGHRWLLQAVADAREAEPGVEVEPKGRTGTRMALTLAVWAGLVIVALTFSPSIAAPMGGVIFGIAALDLRAVGKLAAYRAEGVELVREVGTTWIASGRRPIFRLLVKAGG
jgi:hypothetical protein